MRLLILLLLTESLINTVSATLVQKLATFETKTICSKDLGQLDIMTGQDSQNLTTISLDDLDEPSRVNDPEEKPPKYSVLQRMLQSLLEFMQLFSSEDRDDVQEAIRYAASFHNHGPVDSCYFIYLRKNARASQMTVIEHLQLLRSLSTASTSVQDSLVDYFGYIQGRFGELDDVNAEELVPIIQMLVNGTRLMSCATQLLKVLRAKNQLSHWLVLKIFTITMTAARFNWIDDRANEIDEFFLWYMECADLIALAWKHHPDLEQWIGKTFTRQTHHDYVFALARLSPIMAAIADPHCNTMVGNSEAFDFIEGTDATLVSLNYILKSALQSSSACPHNYTYISQQIAAKTIITDSCSSEVALPSVVKFGLWHLLETLLDNGLTSQASFSTREYFTRLAHAMRSRPAGISENNFMIAATFFIAHMALDFDMLHSLTNLSEDQTQELSFILHATDNVPLRRIDTDPTVTVWAASASFLAFARTLPTFPEMPKILNFPLQIFLFRQRSIPLTATLIMKPGMIDNWLQMVLFANHIIQNDPQAELFYPLLDLVNSDAPTLSQS